MEEGKEAPLCSSEKQGKKLLSQKSGGIKGGEPIAEIGGVIKGYMKTEDIRMGNWCRARVSAEIRKNCPAGGRRNLKRKIQIITYRNPRA